MKIKQMRKCERPSTKEAMIGKCQVRSNDSD